MGCPGICGGNGWLMSLAAVWDLVFVHGDRWLDFMAYQLEHGSFHYDVHAPTVMSWIKGMKQVNLPELATSLCNDPSHPSWKCDRITPCNCSRADHPAGWHLKGGNIEKNLARLDAFD